MDSSTARADDSGKTFHSDCYVKAVTGVGTPISDDALQFEGDGLGGPEKPLVCPYCWDNYIEPVAGVELIATSLPGARRIPTAKVFHCSRWHIFAIFPSTLQGLFNAER